MVAIIFKYATEKVLNSVLQSALKCLVLEYHIL